MFSNFWLYREDGVISQLVAMIQYFWSRLVFQRINFFHALYICLISICFTKTKIMCCTICILEFWCNFVHITIPYSESNSRCWSGFGLVNWPGSTPVLHILFKIVIKLLCIFINISTRTQSRSEISHSTFVAYMYFGARIQLSTLFLIKND